MELFIWDFPLLDKLILFIKRKNYCFKNYFKY